MKHLIHRSLRAIRKSWTQFAAIVLIIAIGSAIFTGLLGTLRILNQFIPAYYTRYQLSDAWVVVEGFSPERIEAIQRDHPEIRLEGRLSFRSDALVNDQTVYLIFNGPARLNQAMIVEGRMPRADHELLMDVDFAERQGFKLNDIFGYTIEGQRFVSVISGLFYSPEYAYKSRDFSDAASNKAGVAVLQLTESGLRTLLRRQAVFVDARTELKSTLADARRELVDGFNTLEAAQNELNRTRRGTLLDLNQQRSDLSAQRIEVLNTRSDLLSAKTQLDAGLAQLTQGLQLATQQFDDAQAQLDAARLTLQAAFDNNALDADTFAAQSAILDAQQASLSAERTQTLDALTAQRTTLLTQAQQLNAGLAELNAGLERLDEGLDQLEAGLIEARRSFDQAQRDLDDARETLMDAEKTLEVDALKAQATLEAKLDERYELLVAGSDLSRFQTRIEAEDGFEVFIARSDFPGYAMIDNILDPIRIMTQIFPLLFFIVSAILILITMSKHVDQDRTQIAILKALGLSAQPILMSYIVYGWLAALSGSLVFGVLGNLYIPYVLLGIFDTRFSLPPIPIPLFLDLNAMALVAALGFASLAISLALIRVLKERPAEGMRPRPPKKAKTVVLERIQGVWKRLSYGQKLMVRNITLARLKLVFSSIGIVGSITLLITGLSLQNSANVMVNNAMSAYRFDAIVRFESSVDELEADWLSRVDAREWRQSGSVTVGDERLPFMALDVDQRLVNLQRPTGETIAMRSNSLIIPHSLALTQNLRIGDVLTLRVDDRELDLAITDISNQYLGRTLTFSFDTLAALAVERRNTTLAITFDDADVVSAVRRDDQVKAVDTVGSMQAQSREIMAMLDQIILIILVSSLALTLSVIYNLSSINIQERERELATLRVLGYTLSEVQRLIYTENYVLLALGSILGVPVGIGLFQTIARRVSTREFFMLDQIHWPTLMLALALAWGMTFIVNRVLAVRIRRIALVEALKAVE
jgi:putative ABC transport system permease protein